MVRMARIVAAGVPHLVTQRGNRQQRTFFCDDDYRLYQNLLAEHCRRSRVEVWAWCLMPNHVHLVVVPTSSDGLARAIGDTHRTYSRHVNRREGWTGYLWQGRFASCALDETYSLLALRYVERNPVRTGLVGDVAGWPWSSARARFGLAENTVFDPSGLDGLLHGWRDFLEAPLPSDQLHQLRMHVRTGRPLGDPAFVHRFEKIVLRRLRPKKRVQPRVAEMPRAVLRG